MDSYSYDDSQYYEYGYDTGEADVPRAVFIDRIITIDIEALTSRLDADIAQVMGVTYFAYPAAVMLLREFKWSPSMVLERYFQAQEETLRRLRIDSEAALHTNGLVRNEKKMMCPLCLSPISRSKGIALSSCGHFFCRTCWHDSVLYKAKESRGLIGMGCPMDGCTELVDHRLLLDLFSKMLVGGNDEASSNNIKELMQRGFLKSYVDSSLRYRWCPNPQSCTGIIYMPEGFCSPESAHCEWCGTDLCFRCGGAPHAPATCAEAEKWLTKVRDGGANIAYVLQHTKACPRCKARIEKNEGCNHMTCKCGYEFCWICLGNWKKHAGDAYNCDNAAKVSKHKDEKEHKVFERNYRSYVSHLSSDKLEARSIEGIRTSATAAEVRDLPSLSTEALGDLLDKIKATLHSARCFLAFCYVRSYSIDMAKTERTQAAQLFLYQRGLLEKATEDLSQYLNGHFSHKGRTADFDAIIRANELVQKWLSNFSEYE